jgi:hypothetical protein
MEYHVIIIPLFFWETAAPKSLNDLKKLMQITGRLFGFQLLLRKNESTRESSNNIMSSSKTSPKALLSWRLPHIIHEVGSIKNITEIIKEKAAEQFATLKIEEAYASDFAIELISSSIDVFWRWQDDYQFDQIATKLSDILYEVSNPFPGAVSIVVCRIILCEDITELKTIAENYQLNEVITGLCIGGEKTPTDIQYNIFNFIRHPWRDIFISGPIVTLKPEILRSQGYHSTIDELSFLLSMIHSIGKFYVISESIKGVLANLEWLSWYSDELFEEFESSFCWVQRNLTNIEKHLHKIEKEIKSEVTPLSRIATSPESVALIQQVYGVEYLPYLSSFFSIMDNFRIKKYNVPTEDLKKAVWNDLKLLSRRLAQFCKEFSNTRDSWKELRRSRITTNQLLLSLLGILLTLIINIILKLL